MFDTGKCFKITGLTLLLMFVALSPIQAREVVVTVTDMAGQPLEGAVVSLAVGTTKWSPRSMNEAAIMDQVGMQFLPRVLAINTGDYVSFPNSDNVRHHVYSFSEPKVFEIKLYADTPKEPLQFDKPGIVVLGCNIHDGMLGYLYVTEPGYVSGTTDKKGNLRLQTNGDISGARIWHERLSVIETELVELSEEGIAAFESGENTYLVTIDPEVPAPDTAPEKPSPTGFGNTMRR